MLAKVGTRNFYKNIFIFIVAILPSVLGGVKISLFLQALLVVYLGYKFLRSLPMVDIFSSLLILMNSLILLISLTSKSLTLGILLSLALLTLLPIYVKNELKTSNEILKSLFIFFSLAIVINSVSILINIYSPAENIRYFLGGKNALSIFQIPASFFVAYRSYIYNGNLNRNSAALLLLSATSMVVGGSSTGVIIAILVIVYLLFSKFINIMPRIYLLFLALIQGVMFFSTSFYTSNILNTVVVDYLGKDLSFSDRQTVWQVAIAKIPQSFFGYGRGNSIIAEGYVSKYGQQLTEAHSAVLEILLTGGLLLLLIYIATIMAAISVKITKENKRLLYTAYFFVFLFFVIGLTESVPFKIELWLMLAVIFSTDSIIKNKKIGNKQ